MKRTSGASSTLKWGGLEVAVLKFTIREDFTEELAKKLSVGASRVEHAIANEVAKDTAKFVPFRSGRLSNGVQINGGSIVYPGPYAHYLYEGVVYVDPVTHAAGFLTEDGWKSRYGVKKVKTGRPLDIKGKFSKDSKNAPHPDAQSHWFEASKAQNLEKWETLAGRMMKREIKK